MVKMHMVKMKIRISGVHKQMQDIRSAIASAGTKTDLVNILHELSGLAQEANNAIRHLRVEEAEVRARENFDAIKQVFCNEAVVGDAIAFLCPSWLDPEFPALVSVNNDGDDDNDDDSCASFHFVEDEEETDRTWCRVYEVELYLKDISVDIDTYIKGLKFKQDCPENRCETWNITCVELNDWDMTKEESKHAKAIREACGVLLDNTDCDVLMHATDSSSQRFKHRGSDYCDKWVNISVPVYVGVRCYMSVARVVWMTAVVRGVAQKNNSSRFVPLTCKRTTHL